MPPHSVSRLLNRNGAVSLVGLPPVFLAPALLTLANSVQRSAFSSSSAYLHRNRKRGVSAIHRTGPKQQLSASKYPLPQPVAPEDREARQANPNHGLWAFFPQNRHAIPTPEEEYAFGRSWTIQELRRKGWYDLHSLWWACVKERNRIATSEHERERLAAGYGQYESERRDETVRETQSAIKTVLRERWYAWEDARQLYSSGYRPKQEDLLEEDYGDELDRKE